MVLLATQPIYGNMPAEQIPINRTEIEENAKAPKLISKTIIDNNNTYYM